METVLGVDERRGQADELIEFLEGDVEGLIHYLHFVL